MVNYRKFVAAAVFVATVVVGGFDTAGAAEPATVVSRPAPQVAAPPNRVGSSCVTRTSTDTPTFDFGTSVVFSIRCNWSPYNAALPSGYRKEQRPFATGCDPVCTNVAPTDVTFTTYTGTSGSTDPDIRHGSGNNGRPCTVNSFTVVAAPVAGSGEWSFRCNALTPWSPFYWGLIADAAITVDGTTLMAGVCNPGCSTLSPSGPSLVWSGSVDRVPTASWASAEPWFSWTPTACADLVVTPLSSSVIRYGGDSVAFLWSRPVGSTVGNKLEYRFVNFPGPSLTYTALPAGFTGSGGTFTVVWPAALNGLSIAAAGMQLECSTLVAGVMVKEFRRLGVDAGWVAIATVVGTVCGTSGFRWPADKLYAAGDTAFMRLVVPVSGSIQRLVVSQVAKGSTYATLLDYVTATVRLDAAGAAITPYAAEPVAAAITVFVGVTFAAAGTLSDLTFRCQNPDSTWEAGGRWSFVGGGLENTATRPDGCSGADLGWNPTSWVPGMWKIGVCWVFDLVVPSSEVTAGWGTKVDGLRARPPVQWIDQGVAFVQGSSLSFGQWSVVGPACVDVLSTAICPRTWDNAASVPGWLVSMLLFGLWTTVVVAIWRFF